MQFSKGHSRTSTAKRAAGLKWLAATLALVILVCLCAVTAYAEQPYISKVDVKDMGDYVQIAVSSNSALAVHGSRLGDRYLVFDLYGRLAPSQQKRVDIGAGGIKSIRCGWYQDSPAVARIAIGTTKTMEYSISANKGQRLTTIKIRKQDAQAPKPLPAEKPVPGGGVQSAVTAAATAPAVVEQAKPAKLVSLDFVASDIHDVLKALGLQGGVNIVASPDVKGNITVSLNKVTVEEALKLVANLSGYKYQFVDGTYIVGTADNVRALAASAGGDDKATEVVTITYADPAVVSKMLESQFPGMTVSSSVPAGKEIKGPAVLVLSGSKVVVEPAKALAESIEAGMAQNAQDMVSEFYEVKYADINELAAMVPAVVAGVKVSIGPTAGFNLKRPEAVAMDSNDKTATAASSAPEQKAPSKILLLQGPSLEVEKAKQVIAKLDVAQPQIMIEAKIVDISDTGKDELGIEWGDTTSGLTNTSFTENTDGNQALTIGRFSRSPLMIDATIRGLVQSGKGKVLASPNVLAIDGKTASAFIGDEVKYVIQITRTEYGVTVTTETTKVGVQLHTVSTISQDGFITMNLHPEVSVITGWKDIVSAGISLPLVARRYVDSTVRVKDGETIVIGGLIKDEEIKSMSGVPFLKDLPFIGNLFRSKTSQKSHSEIMMFITPRVLTDTI